MTLTTYVPLFGQLANYNKIKFSSDLVAALVLSILLIPQSLAYSLLAGMPPQYGLYASILPCIIYSIFGSSTSLAVGPVAIASIMTASALASVTQAGIVGYIEGAIILSILSGIILFLMGVFRLGFIANFLSHSVVTGFITAASLLIALSQFKYILGYTAQGSNFFDIAYSLIVALKQTHTLTLFLGSGSIIALLLARRYLQRFFERFGIDSNQSKLLSRLAPVIVAIVTILIVAFFKLDDAGVAVVGSIPPGIAQFGLPSFNLASIKALFLPALFISIIGYVESIALGRTFAVKKQEKIDPNQELLALGGANVASGIAGTFPVTGGVSRSIISYDAGAQTQVAGILTALGICLVSIFLTPYLYFLPLAMLAATIIVAVLALVDFSVVRHAWIFSKSDFYAITMTITVTLFFGVEAGVASGIICSIILHLYHTSRPHVAEIGLISNSQHFRNIQHFNVETITEITSIRIDESLLFSNVNYIEEYIDQLISNRPQTQELILHCGAINTIDLSALEMLESLNKRLQEININLHLSELKFPVKKLLDNAHFFEKLSGSLYLSQYDAYTDLCKRYE